VTAVAKGARTREGASTRQAIYEAALDAFSENGYAGASLRDIARRVGIEVASLYNHIDSKEELLFRIIENCTRLSMRRRRMIRARGFSGRPPRTSHFMRRISGIASSATLSVAS
jgi:AcrR family transcriptional regulator